MDSILKFLHKPLRYSVNYWTGCEKITDFSPSFQVLALENNVMELQMFLDKAQADLTASKEDLAVMETEHKELANEYIALKTSHVQLTADYQKEVG